MAIPKRRSRLTQREVDRIYTALRPRLPRDGRGAGGGGGTMTIPAHTHSADQIGSVPAGDVAGDDVQEALDELAEEKLARDGHQPMLGDLDMDEHNIIDPVRIDFSATDETVIRYLDGIEFDLAGQHTTHTEGALHWDPSLKMLVMDAAYNAQIPVASVYVRVVNVWGSTINAGEPAAAVGWASGLVAIAGVDNPPSENVIGIAATTMTDGQPGWLCMKGYVRVPGAFAGHGGIQYLDSSIPAMLTDSPPTNAQRGCIVTIRMGYGVDDDTFVVDIERLPQLQDLSDVSNEEATCGDVLVRQVHPDSGCEQWKPSGLWTQVLLDFGESDRHEKVFDLDFDDRVKGQSDIITMSPCARPVWDGPEESPPLHHPSDEHEFDAFACACVPVYDEGADKWRVRAYINSLRGVVVGRYWFQYTVSNPATYNCVGETE